MKSGNYRAQKNNGDMVTISIDNNGNVTQDGILVSLDSFSFVSDKRIPDRKEVKTKWKRTRKL